MFKERESRGFCAERKNEELTKSPRGNKQPEVYTGSRERNKKGEEGEKSGGKRF